MTKLLSICVLILFSLYNCVGQEKPIKSEVLDKMYQSYTAETSENDDSKFTPTQRIVEFEYSYLIYDSLVSVKCMMTTGFNEGVCTQDFQLIKMNGGEEVEIPITNLKSMVYSSEYNYSSSTPSAGYKTIQRPGKTTTSVQSNGSVKTTHHPPSTENVWQSGSTVSNSSKVQSVFYNQFEFELKTSELDNIREDFIDYFTIATNEGVIELIPSDKDLELLYDFLFEDSIVLSRD